MTKGSSDSAKLERRIRISECLMQETIPSIAVTHSYSEEKRGDQMITFLQS